MMDLSLSQPAAAPASHTRQSIRLLLLLAGVLSFTVFWYGGDLFSIPSEPYFGASLLQQTAWPLAILEVAVLLAGCTLLATMLLGRHWFLAGLLAATAGLSALSIHGGPMRYVLFNAQSPAVFLGMIVEMFLLFAMVGGLWLALWERRGPLPSSPGAAETAGEGSPFGTLALQVGVMAAILILFAQTDLKKQTLISLGLAALCSTAMAERSSQHARTARWYWLGPLIVGVAGYAAAYVQPAGWSAGDVQGLLAGLARPVPLDYASVGVAGTLLGYWFSTNTPDLAIGRLRGSIQRP